MKLTNEDVQQILELLDATKYDELHLQTERFKLILRRNQETGDWSQESQLLSSPNFIQTAAASPRLANPPSAPSPVPPIPSAHSDPGFFEVRAHLPGTFYRAPVPGAPPFVEVGARIEKETVVGILETMKLMNAVHAGTTGEVAEICFANAQFAEKGAVLMRIKQRTA
jgi:acetyl-CoA carboxylase biotin carboxyl carrier protein